MLIPRPCCQSYSKIALDCPLLAKSEVNTVLIKMPEPLLSVQHVLSH